MINERDQFPPPNVDPDPTPDPETLTRILREGWTDCEDDAPELGAAAGLEECTAEDFRIPALKLRQTLTEGAPGVPEGAWFLTEESSAALRLRSVVVLEVKKERNLLLPRGGSEAAQALVERIRTRTGVEVPLDHEGPVCWSRDRITPVQEEGLLPLATDCTTCSLSRWRTENGRRVQHCGESYRILLFDLASDLPAVYHARGAAIRPTRELLTRLQVACRRAGSPTCAFQLTLSSEELEGPDGTYWIPRYGHLLPLEKPGLVAQLAEIRRVFSRWPADQAA